MSSAFEIIQEIRKFYPLNYHHAFLLRQMVQENPHLKLQDLSVSQVLPENLIDFLTWFAIHKEENHPTPESIFNDQKWETNRQIHNDFLLPLIDAPNLQEFAVFYAYHKCLDAQQSIQSKIKSIGLKNLHELIDLLSFYKFMLSDILRILER